MSERIKFSLSTIRFTFNGFLSWLSSTVIVLFVHLNWYMIPLLVVGSWIFCNALDFYWSWKDYPFIREAMEKELRRAVRLAKFKGEPIPDLITYRDSGYCIRVEDLK